MLKVLFSTGDGDTIPPISVTQSNSSSEGMGAPLTYKSQCGSSSDHNEEVKAALNQPGDNNQKVEVPPIQIDQSDSGSELLEIKAPPTDTGQEDCSDNLEAELGSHDPSNINTNDGTPSINGCGPQQLVSDRMQYLTESCSYGDSDDYLTLATPDSQITSHDGDITITSHDNVITSGTCHDEDPLAISDEGKSLDKRDSLATARQRLYNCLQKKAASKYPNLLKKINGIIDDLKSCSDSECDDMLSIIYNALDYHMTSRK